MAVSGNSGEQAEAAVVGIRSTFAMATPTSGSGSKPPIPSSPWPFTEPTVVGGPIGVITVSRKAHIWAAWGLRYRWPAVRHPSRRVPDFHDDPRRSTSSGQ